MEETNPKISLYCKYDDFTLYHGDMTAMLEVLTPSSIDSIVTDPPYELNFMNKGWDNSGVAFQKSTWEKCYEVLKPGGYLLAFGGTRTFHRIACAIEDAGFEIRDTIMWLYGSGFPKSMNIGLMIDKKNGVESKVIGHSTNKIHLDNIGNAGYKEEFDIKQAQNEWGGWGTSLKPAYEPVIVARKPCEGSCVDNVLKYGVGGINIDDCRVGDDHFVIEDGDYDNNPNQSCFGNVKRTPKEYDGRFPSNVILTYDSTDEAEVCGGMPYTKSLASEYNFELADNNNPSRMMTNIKSGVHFEDEGSASRYFYCAKASQRDRDEGLENFEAVSDGSKGAGLMRVCEFCGAPQLKPELCHCEVKSWVLPARKNIHPTVKPCDLMQYLIRLVTPKGGTVLDPFNGSGSTGKACMYENKDRNSGYKYIGIELTSDYLPIAEARIKYVFNSNVMGVESATKKKIASNQMSLFNLP